MRQIPLGRTAMHVTDYCLGTMTYGTTTPEDDAHRQLSMAQEAGLNFLDTAEMYPVTPVSAETVGLTETIIGNWIAQNPGHGYHIATKITGLNGAFVRFGQPITGATFTEALDGSLRRLQSDHIHLYQLHWPNRGSYHFRQNWGYDPSAQNRDETIAHMDDVLEAAERAVAAGKLGAIGLSNESAWGTAQWLVRAEAAGLPRVAAIQNEYSLLCRLYDTDLGELAVNEDVTLLAFSPLAVGLLTGKYRSGVVPEGSRMGIEPALSGRNSPRAAEAVDAYLAVAEAHAIDPVHMALAFTVQRPFPVSTIFGARTSGQLEHILDGRDTHLSAEVLEALNAVHQAHPMPY